MKIKIIWSVVSLFLCVLSGIVGAYSMTVLQERRAERSTLRVSRLELTDAKKNVRAVFFVEADGSVFLRMLSRENVPVVELGMSEDPGPFNMYTPSGGLIIRDGARTPVIQLRTVGQGEAALSFSSSNTPGQVEVGYMPYGDVISKHDLGTWGIEIRGAKHESTGVGVRTEDGAAHEFLGPRMTGPGK